MIGEAGTAHARLGPDRPGLRRAAPEEGARMSDAEGIEHRPGRGGARRTPPRGARGDGHHPRRFGVAADRRVPCAARPSGGGGRARSMASTPASASSPDTHRRGRPCDAAAEPDPVALRRLGPGLDDEVVRLVLALKAIGLARGYSGVRRETSRRCSRAAPRTASCRASRPRARSAPRATSRRSPICRAILIGVGEARIGGRADAGAGGAGRGRPRADRARRRRRGWR